MSDTRPAGHFDTGSADRLAEKLEAFAEHLPAGERARFYDLVQVAHAGLVIGLGLGAWHVDMNRLCGLDEDTPTGDTENYLRARMGLPTWQEDDRG